VIEGIAISHAQEDIAVSPKTTLSPQRSFRILQKIPKEHIDPSERFSFVTREPSKAMDDHAHIDANMSRLAEFSFG